MMSKTTLVWFWVMWLLDVLMALFGYHEFLNGLFGRYANPSFKYISIWVIMLMAALVIICGSLYFKNHGHASTALSVAAIPLVLALPYVLFLVVAVSGKGTNWH